MQRRPSTSRRLVPPLSALVAFESAARHGSFTRAAQELSLTQSAISRRVNLLEEMLGLQLFQRVGNTVSLTAVGSFYAERIQDALSGLATATQEATLFLGRCSLLRLGLPPTFGTRWLIPRIGRFLQEHRDIEVVFSACLPGETDFSRNEMDAVIHAGGADVPGMHFDKLLDERLVVVAHPDIAAGIASAEGLRAVTLLVQALRPEAWAQWFGAQGLERDRNQTMLSFSLFSMVVEAAQDRLGVALVPELLVETELQSGRLVTLFEGAAVHTNSLYLAYPVEKGTYPPIQIFRKWLLAQCRAEAQAGLRPQNRSALRQEKLPVSVSMPSKAV
jgi:LysR family transcriptional regulator, glycine cleavage system transcriptional activator